MSFTDEKELPDYGSEAYRRAYRFGAAFAREKRNETMDRSVADRRAYAQKEALRCLDDGSAALEDGSILFFKTVDDMLGFQNSGDDTLACMAGIQNT